MSTTYYPSGDADFANWLANFNNALTAHALAVGLTADDAAMMDIKTLLWSEKYGAHLAAQTAAQEATAGKNTARAEAIATLRPFVARIQSYPGTTDEMREAFGLRPHGTGTSGLELGYVDKPMANIDIREHLKHNVKVYTVTPEGVKKGKPANVIGFEIVRTIGTRPATQEEMEPVGLMTKTKFSLEYSPDDTGKQAYYAMRWVHSDGTPGAWGDIQSATIAA